MNFGLTSMGNILNSANDVESKFWKLAVPTGARELPMEPGVIWIFLHGFHMVSSVKRAAI